MAQVRRRGPNRYTIGVYLGRDINGKRQYHYETFHGTRSQAQQRGAELDVQMCGPGGPKASAMTLGQFLKDKWLPMTKPSLADHSYETYRWHVDRLAQVAGDLPLYGLTAMALQERLARIEGLAPRSIKGIYITLGTALRQAVGWGLIPLDPTVGIKAPRVPKQKKAVLNPDELHQVLDVARHYKHGLVIRLLAVGGMRLSECLGLFWSDLDFDRNLVRIMRTVDTRKRRLRDDGNTKTASALRVIAVDSETMDLLADRKHAVQKAKVRPMHKDRSLIFQTDDGRPLRARGIEITLDRIIKRAGVTRVTVHGLRHSAGSMLLDAGVPLARVSEFLGHSNPSTTASIYIHPVEQSGSLLGVLGADADKSADRKRESQ